MKPAIAMQEVESSQIHSIGHDPETKTLAIRFLGKKQSDDTRAPGALYHYPDVTAEQHTDFMAAPSKGTWFGTHIRHNPKHPHTKIEPVVADTGAEKAAA